MKRNTPQHPKLLMLAGELGLSRWGAVGVLESIWHFTAQYAPAGDIGRYPAAVITEAIGWTDDADKLIAALIKTVWLDRDDACNYRVHDWSQHCDDGVQLQLARRTELFADGSRPKLTRLTQAEREPIERAYIDAAKSTTGHALPPKHTACTQEAHGKHTAEAEAEALALASAEAQPVASDEISQSCTSDSDSSSDSDRAIAYMQYQGVIQKLFGHNGAGMGKHPRGSSQYAADETVARQWWDDFIWPRGGDGNASLDRVTLIIKQAACKDKPMAWLTQRIRKELA